jgi:hypothetical protein
MKTKYYLITITCLLFACKNDVAMDKTDISYLEKEFQKTKADSTFNQLIQAYGTAVRESEDNSKKEAFLIKAIDLCTAPEKIYLKEVLSTELLKVNPQHTKAADYLYSLAEGMEYKNKAEAASMLYNGFCKRFPNDSRSKDALKKIDATHTNSAVYFKKLMSDILTNPGKEGINEENALKFIDLSESFALAFPEEKMAPVYLFQAADISRALGSIPKVISLYDWIYLYYPEFSKASLALFLKGYTLDAELKKYDEAKVIYENFLIKYPQDSLSKDVKFLLANLGKSDDALFKEMEMEKK